MTSTASTRPPARRFAGRYVAIGLLAFIAIVASVAWVIHQQNIRARSQARDAAEAAEATEGAGPAPAAR